MEQNDKTLAMVLGKMGTEVKENIGAICRTSRLYVIADIGETAAAFGYVDDAERWRGANAYIPITSAQERRIAGKHTSYCWVVNGFGLLRHKQLESGIIVPQEVASEAGLSYEEYCPRSPMYLSGHVIVQP